MNYNESLTFLNSFINYERMVRWPSNRSLNLERMRVLLSWFNHPEKNYESVIIAGTKGKGSTGAFLESLLSSREISCGFYSSPHLVTPRERIRLNKKMISKDLWRNNCAKIKRMLSRQNMPDRLGAITYFEILTLLAALVFKEAGVRVGIFEVGLGGRLDATNALGAKLSILTTIDYDHEEFLGRTLSKIAGEKAAVIAADGDAICLPQQNEVTRVFKRTIKLKRARPHWVQPLKQYKLSLPGRFQQLNAAGAFSAFKILSDKLEFSSSESDIGQAFSSVLWPGRLEYHPGAPSRLFDVAHNPASVRRLLEYLKSDLKPSSRKTLVFSALKGKNFQSMLASLGPYFEDVVLTEVDNPKGASLASLLTAAKGNCRRIYAEKSVSDALERAGQLLNGNGLTVITGSFYLVGRAKEILSKKKEVLCA